MELYIYIYMYIYIRERETFNKYIKVGDFWGVSFVAILWLIRFWEFFRPPPTIPTPPSSIRRQRALMVFVILKVNYCRLENLPLFLSS